MVIHLDSGISLCLRIRYRNDVAPAGQPKTQKDVEALNKKLNIQLDNLCQFLPQEKVVEFSKMSPEELLVNTERAIGDAHLAQMHSKLINGGMELRDMHAAKCDLKFFSKPFFLKHAASRL